MLSRGRTTSNFGQKDNKESTPTKRTPYRLI